jgi:hypothetical protein
MLVGAMARKVIMRETEHVKRAGSWILVIGLLAACQAAPAVSTSPSATPPEEPPRTSSAESTPSPTATATESATVEATASLDAGIPLDSVVTTSVDGLMVRRSPGTGGQSIGFLELGTPAFVISGPTEVDGVPWYMVTGMGLPYLSGCVTTPPDQPIACPAFQGWVAGANAAGDPWIEAAEPPPCPDPALRPISEAGYTMRLVCWPGGQEIAFDAWWPEIPPGAGLGGICPEEADPAGFLFCQQINYNGLAASPEEGFTARLSLSTDPASGVSMPDRGQWVRVTGGFDHPASEGCAALAPADVDPLSAQFSCRLAFVPTSVSALGP